MCFLVYAIKFRGASWSAWAWTRWQQQQQQQPPQSESWNQRAGKLGGVDSSKKKKTRSGQSAIWRERFAKCAEKKLWKIKTQNCRQRRRMFGESSKVLKRLKFCLSESEHWEFALTCFAAEKTLIYELVSQEHDIKPNLLRDSLLQNCLRHFPVFARAQHGSRYKRNFLPLIRNFQVFRTVENADFFVCWCLFWRCDGNGKLW